MSLPIIHDPAKYPGAIVVDLRKYADALGLPNDWHRKITHVKQEHAAGSALWIFKYDGKPFATYATDVLGEIQSPVARHIPIPPPPDPLVVATECALAQPKDREWCRFKHLAFRRAEVAFVNNVDNHGNENGCSFEICFRSGKHLVCGNEKNYQNTGMSTCEFFLTHVLELEPRAKL